MSRLVLLRFVAFFMLTVAGALVAVLWGQTGLTNAKGLATPEPLASPLVDEFLDYFSEIAFGTEYGASTTVAHKWTGDLRIQVKGEATPEDLATLAQVVEELNHLAEGVTLTLTDQAPNVEFHFAPESRFPFLEPNYVPTNYGYSWVWWDEDGAIYRGRVLISSEGLTQQERDHLIREELTQSLGLFRDSWKYPESIFYQGWTTTTEFAPQDQFVIESLYRPAVLPGMTRNQVLNVLAAD